MVDYFGKKQHLQGLACHTSLVIKRILLLIGNYSSQVRVFLNEMQDARYLRARFDYTNLPNNALVWIHHHL